MYNNFTRLILQLLKYRWSFQVFNCIQINADNPLSSSIPEDMWGGDFVGIYFVMGTEEYILFDTDPATDFQQVFDLLDEW